MRQIKVTVGAVAATSCFITLFLYYWYHTTPSVKYQSLKSPKSATTLRNYLKQVNLPMRHVPLNQIYPDDSNDDESFEVTDYSRKSYFVNTPGCQIPVAMIKFAKNKKRQQTCGKRAIFLKKFEKGYVRVSVKARAMKQYSRRSANFDCCYRFIKRSSHNGHEHTNIEYTSCKKTRDGDMFELETDFVNVKCFEQDSRNVTHIIYSDVYVFIKKIPTPSYQISKREKYNVLMIGMDSMSLSRTVQTMPRTVNFFKENGWLGYRGYHKVADNTFPNLMAALTGSNLTTIPKRCSKRMDECNNLLIWSRYKQSGYVTAYGEDYLRLPDTFNKEYAFKKPPTDHYLRTLYLHGEHELFNKSLVCTGKVSSGQHLLDYAFDFTNTYRYNSFFGLFWMNSFSHNVNSHPEDSDKMFENFFNQLTYTGILENTFVIFFSDHGIRFGDYRAQPASYYEERMPALFTWIPLRFRAEQSLYLKAAIINQFRLVTPYDLYNTLVDINRLAEYKNHTEVVADACPSCHSLFTIISVNRTCADVGIHTKWCSCHRLYPLDNRDNEGMKSVIFAANHIKLMANKVKTERCWGCMKFALSNIFRIHFYYSKSNVYYVVAFSMVPGNVSYEAVVSKKDSRLELVGAVSVISLYRGLGKCAKLQKDRLFCVCQRKENC